MSQVISVEVPDIGDFKSVEVIEVLVKPGDRVTVEQSLITVESDKASMEIPSSHAGVIQEMKVKLGDKVAQGTVVLLLEAEDGAATAAPAAAPAPAAPAPAAAAPAAAPTPAAAGLGFASDPVVRSAPVANAPALVSSKADVSPVNKPHASPSVRAFARELGVPLEEIKGSGAHGRITQQDVKDFSKGVMSGALQTKAQAAAGVGKAAASSTFGAGLLPWPSLDFSKFGTTRLEPLSRIKKISGPNLARNWVMIPHVTQFDDADITDLEQFRVDMNKALEKQGVKLTMLAFVMKACVSVLQKLPNFNASLDEKGENLILKEYYHIGFAADTPQGLVVPVVKNADQKGVGQLAKEISALAASARDGKLKPADMQGASFTISSLGGVGGTAFTPIINAPEVAILGLSKSDLKPRWDGKAFQPRLMLPLSLSYDHRVVDGAQAARFTTLLGQTLADMRRVLL